MQAMGLLASPAAHPRLLQTLQKTCRCQQYRPFVAASPHTRRPLQRASGKGLQWHVQRTSAEPDDAALLAEVPEPEDARGAIAVSMLPVSATSMMLYSLALHPTMRRIAPPCRWGWTCTTQATTTGPWACLRRRSACQARG